MNSNRQISSAATPSFDTFQPTLEERYYLRAHLASMASIAACCCMPVNPSCMSTVACTATGCTLVSGVSYLGAKECLVLAEKHDRLEAEMAGAPACVITLVKKVVKDVLPNARRFVDIEEGRVPNERSSFIFAHLPPIPHPKIE